MRLNIKSPLQRIRRHKLAFTTGIITTLAAIATILSFVFNAFGSTSGSLSASEYHDKIVALCTVATNEQSYAESGLREFGQAFPEATTVTAARDLIVAQVQRQVAAAVDLSTLLEALAPPTEYAQRQKEIIRLLRKNIGRLRNYENELNLLSSPLQLVALVQTVPRAEMNADAVSGRTALLILSGGGCALPRWPIVRVVDWSPQLRLRIRRSAEKTAKNVETAPLSAAAGNGALPNPVPISLAGEPTHRRLLAQRPETERRELRLTSKVPARTDLDAESAETAEESETATGESANSFSSETKSSSSNSSSSSSSSEMGAAGG